MEEAKVKTQFSYSEKEIKSKGCLTVRLFWRGRYVEELELRENCGKPDQSG